MCDEAFRRAPRSASVVVTGGREVGWKNGHIKEARRKGGMNEAQETGRAGRTVGLNVILPLNGGQSSGI